MLLFWLLLIISMLFYAQSRLPLVQSALFEAAMQRHGERIITKTVENAFDASVIEMAENTVELDTKALMHAKSALTEKLQRKLNGKVCAWVPLGNLTGAALLNGHGVKVPVVFSVESAVRVSFDAGLDSAGINRTRYGVTMTVTAQLYGLSVAVPGCVTVETHFPVYETVLEGAVPQYISVRS